MNAKLHSYFVAHSHHLLRAIILVLVALVAYLVWTDTASGEEETLVILSTDFELRRYTAQGLIEARPKETELACRCLGNSLAEAVDAHPVVNVVPLPALDAAEQAVVDEHVALLETIIDSVRYMAKNPGHGATWITDMGPELVTGGRYSMGDGLAFLRERTGADKALILTGWHLEPTAGRQVLQFLLSQGQALAAETGSLALVMADLTTGELVWFRSLGEIYDPLGYAILGEGREIDDAVVTNPAAAQAMLRDLLTSYTGSGGAS